MVNIPSLLPDPATPDADGTALRPPPAVRSRRTDRPAAADRPLSGEAVEMAKRCGTYSRGERPFLCGGCREWVAAIYYILPQYPRTHFCEACATAFGQGPPPRGGQHGSR